MLPNLVVSLQVFIIAFVFLTIYYLSPPIKGFYEKAKHVKRWKDKWKPILFHAIVTFVLSLAITDMIKEGIKWYEAAEIAILLRIIPRAFETYVQTRYDSPLIYIEIIGGTLAIVIMAYSAAVLLGMA